MSEDHSSIAKADLIGSRVLPSGVGIFCGGSAAVHLCWSPGIGALSPCPIIGSGGAAADVAPATDVALAAVEPAAAMLAAPVEEEASEADARGRTDAGPGVA